MSSLTPNSISSSSSGVDVEAVLTNVYPIKNKPFVAELIDETQSINLFWFDPSIQSKLKAQEDKKFPILLKNVDVKVIYTKKLEVVVQRYSEVTTSPKHITDIDAIGAKPILPKELPTLKEFDKGPSSRWKTIKETRDNYCRLLRQPCSHYLTRSHRFPGYS